MNARELQRTAQELRIQIVDMIHTAGSGHSGGSLSCAEILTVLYHRVMNIRPGDPRAAERDRFVLSKGHAAPALYATLSNRGFFEGEELATLRCLESRLQGHPCMFKLPGIEMSTGSLGMGISVGVGMALTGRQPQHPSFRVYVLCGDGELQEGQNWEAMMAAARWKLDNLTIVIDRNDVQLDGPVHEIMPIEDLEAKLNAFGMKTLLCDGHSCAELIETFETALGQNTTTAIIARTVKGKGVSFMEGESAWHGKPIGDEDHETAIKELREQLHGIG